MKTAEFYGDCTLSAEDTAWMFRVIKVILRTTRCAQTTFGNVIMAGMLTFCF